MRAHPHGSREHKRARRWHLARYRPGTTRCAIGGETLTAPGRQLDLAHSDDGTHYLGLACRTHNRGDANGRPGGNRWGGTRYGRAGRKRQGDQAPPDREARRRNRIARRQLIIPDHDP